MLPLLAFIFGLLSPNPLQASGDYRRHESREDMDLVESYFEDFLRNHKRPPLGATYSTDTVVTTGPALVKELAHADDPNLDWMIEIFGKEKMAEDLSLLFDSKGLIETPKGPALHDPWGNPYYLLIDFDNDNHLTEPANLGSLTFTDRNFLMWSAGPDGKYGSPETNLDNLYSYPGHTDSYQSILQKKNRLQQSLFIQLLACLAMTGIIWIVQVAIYPLLDKLHGDVFQNYHTRYMNRVSFVIAPLMLVEALACVGCLWWGDPEDFLIPNLLLAVIWLSTFFIQVPQHKSLTPESVPALVKSNWIRTLAWTTRSALLASMV